MSLKRRMFATHFYLQYFHISMSIKRTIDVLANIALNMKYAINSDDSHQDYLGNMKKKHKKFWKKI
jgi:hypothetical protein